MKMKFFLFFFCILSFIYSEEVLIYEEVDNIAILTLNRTFHLNALNTTVFDELLKLISAIDTTKIAALIITGAGEKSFVAGIDIYEISTLSKRFGKEFSRKGNEVFGTQRLSRLIGQGMAKQMIYGGNYIDAYEALRIGLVSSVYPQGELMEQAKLLAKTIIKNGRNAIASSKKAINEGTQVDIEKGIKIEEEIFGDCFETSEQINGMKNFLEKGKKGKKKKETGKEDKKNLTEEEKEKIKKEEEALLPKGDLIPSTKFMNITYLKEMTTPTMPAILSVGNKNLYNSMTIEWGSLGVAFKKPIFTVYVKPDRYTYQVMEKSDIFTVNFIERKLLKKFAIYGTKSGKDINKEEEAGTHIKFLEKGGITFGEAVEVYVCKKMAKSIIDEKTMDPYIKELYRNNKSIIDEKTMDPYIKELYRNNVKVYKTETPHVLYIGEIIAHYLRES